VIKERYIEWLLRSGALQFGEFKTKSGRLSPYFFNTGHIDSGERLGAVSALYAEAIGGRFGGGVDNLFGPAYKGIPLAVLTAYQLSLRLGRDISYTFNRKEAKDHGEGGDLVGRLYRGGEKVVIVEDVITGGTSFSEVLPLLARYKVEVIGAVVGVDRQERGAGTQSALRDIETKWQIPIVSLVTIQEVVDRLYQREVLGKVWINAAIKQRIDGYLATYAPASATSP